MKTVLAHGCFDVVHIGHIRLLRYARALGDELVVSLLSDEYVRRYKGEGRPVNPLNARIEHMMALWYVDRIAVVDGPGHEAVERMIAEVRPAVYVKGIDCAGKMPEEDYLLSAGIEVVLLDLVFQDGRKVSSTDLMKAH